MKKTILQRAIEAGDMKSPQSGLISSLNLVKFVRVLNAERVRLNKDLKEQKEIVDKFKIGLFPFRKWEAGPTVQECVLGLKQIQQMMHSFWILPLLDPMQIEKSWEKVVGLIFKGWSFGFLEKDSSDDSDVQMYYASRDGDHKEAMNFSALIEKVSRIQKGDNESRKKPQPKEDSGSRTRLNELSVQNTLDTVAKEVRRGGMVSPGKPPSTKERIRILEAAGWTFPTVRKGGKLEAAHPKGIVLYRPTLQELLDAAETNQAKLYKEGGGMPENPPSKFTPERKPNMKQRLKRLRALGWVIGNAPPSDDSYTIPPGSDFRWYARKGEEPKDCYANLNLRELVIELEEVEGKNLHK